MHAMHLNPADQNDAAATEMHIPSENEQLSPEDASKEDANDEGPEDESKTQH
jgi:hypothetical protein